MENAYRENVLRSKDDADKASLKAEADVLEGALLYASSREDAKSANSLLAEASVRARLEKKDMDHHNGMVAYHMRELEASRARYAAAKAKMEATEQQIPQLAAVASSKNAAVLVEQAKCQSLLETSSALKAAKEEQENRVLSLAYIGADKSVLAVDSGARVPVAKMGNAVCMICLVRVAFESHFKSLVHFSLSKHLQEDFQHDADGRPTKPGSLVCGKGCCMCAPCALKSFERAPQTITLEQLTQSGGHLICRGEECVNQTELYDYADLTATPDLLAASGKLYKFFLEEGEKNRLQMLEKVWNFCKSSQNNPFTNVPLLFHWRRRSRGCLSCRTWGSLAAAAASGAAAADWAAARTRPGS